MDAAVNKKDGKLAVNLLNTADPHADANVYVHDDIPVVDPLNILILTGVKTKAVYLEPGRFSLDYLYENGEIQLTLPQLKIHCVIVIENKDMV